MGFRINTNIAAMNSHRNALQTNAGLDKSLNSLSSGLRINTAADDASGMTIADSLRSQAQGLGQAIKNANDGVAVVQTADGALDEYVKIINTVRSKAIQSASDGQNADSRQAIQKDIDRLLEEANNIANTTQFNGQKLLDGTFTNKSFHIGAYAGETVDLSVGNVQTDSVGDVTSINNNASNTTDGLATYDAFETSATGEIVETGSGWKLKSGELTVNGIDIAESLNTLDPTRLQDGKALANAITDATDLLAQSTTKLIAAAAAGGGDLDSTNTLKINGFQVSDITITANDADGSLVRAINDIQDKTGVTAENNGGTITLTAKDGRNISIQTSGSAATRTGLTADNLTNVDSTSAVTALADASTSALTIAEGVVVINGVDLAGTYGDNTTAGSAGDEVLAKIQSIEGLESSTLSTAGELSVIANDGRDVNVAGSGSAQTIFELTEGSVNESAKGVVNIFSNDKVTIGGNSTAGGAGLESFGFVQGGYTPTSNDISLESIDVTNRESAEVAILISDSALKTLDSTRADLGSVQNQLESTVRNISVTQVNVTAAESQIRDVDFAAESANFAKLNILAQSGSYAMSQANAVQQNVMRLLQ